MLQPGLRKRLVKEAYSVLIKERGNETMKKIIDWFTKTIEDLKEFDNEMQGKVQEYSNKQARKAFVVGASVGLVVGLAAAFVL